jgi:hypothetical protein
MSVGRVTARTAPARHIAWLVIELYCIELVVAMSMQAVEKVL